MDVVPIKYGSVHLQKSPLLSDRILLGIDIGSSITKVMFLAHVNQSQLLDDAIDYVTLDYGLFNNEDFTDAMKWTKERAFLLGNTCHTVHVTGNKAIKEKGIIESIFGLTVEFIDCSLTDMAGHKFALEYIGLDGLTPVPVDVIGHGKIESKFIEKFSDALAAKFTKSSSVTEEGKSAIFPCLVNVYNSSSEYYFFDAEGKCEKMFYPNFGGQTFLGLAKCLLDVNTYDDVIKLAFVGDRGNVDTQVKEVMADDPNSPYGLFPPEMPIFPFGKGMDLNKGLEDFKKEDVAHALVGFFCLCIIMQSSQLCILKRIPKIYLTGNMFRSDLFQREITRALMTFPFGIDIKILDLGYYGALGAMLCNNDDKARYCKT